MVTWNGSGGSKKQSQACSIKPHWGPGSGLGQLPGNTPPRCGGWASLSLPRSQRGPGLAPWGTRPTSQGGFRTSGKMEWWYLGAPAQGQRLPGRHLQKDDK